MGILKEAGEACVDGTAAIRLVPKLLSKLHLGLGLRVIYLQDGVVP